MSEYELVRWTPAYEIGSMDGRLIAACLCGSGSNVPNKGMGRAVIAAWETQHQDCAENEGDA